LIITDQERAPMHWPQGFVVERLVSRSRLLRHGVSFENAVCNTAMCSPGPRNAPEVVGLLHNARGRWFETSRAHLPEGP
jgi:hypothetical protein